jgi:hypothetical protein
MKYQRLLEENINLFKAYTKLASIEQIELIERELAIIIPVSIREFFLLVGNDYDYIWGGGGGDKISMLDYNFQLSKKILNECNLSLFRKYFAISAYSGDQFLFVYLDDGEDPPVYRFELELFYCGEEYISGSSSWGYPKGVSKISDSFSDMINTVVKQKLEESNLL